jgi:2-polyprenyl-6-methoxyphenol hydroxylase-like FAD-dependent oxidoreductase
MKAGAAPQSAAPTLRMTNEGSNEPILVVGAGPSGLAAALELARLGRPVRVIDRNPERSRLSKAIGVNPRTLELMEAAGVTERLLAAGRRLHAANLRSAGRLLARIELSRIPHRYNFMLALAQSETERILEERLLELGVAVELRCEAQELEQDEHSVVCTVTCPEGDLQITTPHLIGADGAHSTLRHALGLAYNGHTYPFDWQIVDVRLDGPFAEDELHLLLGADTLLLIVSPGADVFRLASNGPDPIALLPPDARVREEIWRSSFRISYRQVERYQEGRVFLAGDAAHVHSPVGARGMNLGIEDATLLARRIVAGTAEGYGAERHPIARRVIRQTHALTRIATARSPLARWLRDHILPHLLQNAAVQQRLARRIAGLA